MLPKYLTVVKWRNPDVFPVLANKAKGMTADRFFPHVRRIIFGIKKSAPPPIVDIIEVEPVQKKQEPAYISDIVFDRVYFTEDGTLHLEKDGVIHNRKITNHNERREKYVASGVSPSLFADYTQIMAHEGIDIPKNFSSLTRRFLWTRDVCKIP
jgi:hypothetical protein